MRKPFAALLASAIAAAAPTQAHAEVPWAVSQILNGFFASLIYNAATGSTVQNPVFKIPVSHGVFWLGDATTIALKKTAGVDSVKYTFSKLPLESDGTGTFTPTGEITVATTTPVSLTQFVTEPGKYRIIASMLKAGEVVGTAKQIDFMGLTRPVIALQASAPSVTSIRDSQPVRASASVQADMAPSKVTMQIGDVGKPVLASLDPATGFYVADVMAAPGQVGPQPIITTVFFDKASVSTPSSVGAVTVVTPPRLSLVSSPKLLDATYGTTQHQISVKLRNTAPESVLPSQSSTGKANFEVAWFVKGNRVATLGPSAPFSFTFDASDFDALAASRMKKLPIVAVAYHKDYPALTAAPLALQVDTVAPWALPDWELKFSSGPNVIAPAATTLQLSPLAAYDAAAARQHKLRWTWQLPSDSASITGKVAGGAVKLKALKPGSYPVSVSVSDDLGNVKSYSATLQAAAPTLQMNGLNATLSPPSGRVPVTVTPKVATASTHPQERITRYDVELDGAVMGSASTLRPFVITTPGAHELKVIAVSNFGGTAEKLLAVTAIENQPPQCSAFSSTRSKNGAGVVTGLTVLAKCSDPDGKITGYTWEINGSAVAGSTASKSYGFVGCEASATVTVRVQDNSGGETAHTETLDRGTPPANCTNP